MRYLLGTLSEEERAHLEEGYFSDDGKFEELEIAEDELIDRYVRGELSKSDQERFEITLAGSPRVMERVQFARMWKDKLATSKVEPLDVASPVTSLRETPREPTNWWNKLFGLSSGSRTPRLAIAFSVLLVLLGGTGVLSGWLRLREESRRLSAQQAALEQRQRELDKQAADLKAQAEQLAKQLSPQPSPSAEPSPPKQVDELSPAPTRPVFAFTLSPGSVRGGGGRDFKIPTDAVNVQVSLEVRDTDYASYRATVNRDGRRVSSSPFLPLQRSASGGRITFNIPAKLLSPADYTISLDGRTSAGQIDSVEDYSFRIIK
jgi:hypothetical protein